jgi:CheY-like chemotaxis protein
LSAAPKDPLILLVDDDESLLDLMDHVVKKEGYRTDRAVDGQEALAKAAALAPGAIVLDFMMPGMGGYEVLRELQARGYGSIPVVVVTGRAMDEKSVEAVRQESNVREFLQKPVRPAMLVAALHRLLRAEPGGEASS